MAYNQLPERPDESVGSWMITLLITPIPLVGFIYILVLAFGSAAAPSKRNFARAAFSLGDHRPGRDDPVVRRLRRCNLLRNQ